MRKSNLFLNTLSALFILYLAYLDKHGEELERQLAANRLECKQRFDQLQNDYRAEIGDLQEYLQKQYNRAPGTTVQRQAADTEQQGKQQQQGQSGDRAPELTVDQKYRYLYDFLPDLRESGKEILRELLLEREQLAENEYQNAEQLGGIEAQIGELLGAEGYQQYQLLKNSDVEQHHLKMYAQSISNSMPLTGEQERELLYAKLRHKQNFEIAVRSSGLYWGKWSPEERARIQAAVPQALEQYKKSYLIEARRFLSAEQFKQLNNYETTEFNWELKRLLKQIEPNT